MAHGLQYACLGGINCIFANGIRIARVDYLESVAVVLFNTDVLKLRGDYVDSSRTIHVAMGLVPRHHRGGQIRGRK
jgi:hypothetical protein